MNTWIGFCLYVAGGIFIQDLKSEAPSPHSGTSLEFLLAAMRAIGEKHSITQHFTAQLELDIEGAGLPGCDNSTGKGGAVPNTPMNGLLADREGLPMTVGDFHNLIEQANNRKKAGIAPVCQKLDEQFNKERQESSSTSTGLTPSSGIATGGSRENSTGGSPDQAPGFGLWESSLDNAIEKSVLMGIGIYPPTDGGVNTEEPSQQSTIPHFLANSGIQYGQTTTSQAQQESHPCSAVLNNAPFPFRQAEQSSKSLTSAAADTPDVNKAFCPYGDAEPAFRGATQPTEPSSTLFPNPAGKQAPLNWLKPINFDEPEPSWQANLSQPDQPTETHPDHQIPSWMN